MRSCQIHEACNDHILKSDYRNSASYRRRNHQMCEAVTKAGAEFIKTSNRFLNKGCDTEHVALPLKHVGEGVLRKAAGGISSIEDAEKIHR